MDPRQPQPRHPSSSSSKNLLRPPPHHQRPSSTQTSQQQPSQPRPPTSPISAHPSASIAESVTFYGTYPVTIDRGTVIHPRTRIYSFDGPIKIGEGCIISEKCSIGVPPAQKPKPAAGSSGGGEGDEGAGGKEALPILISPNVTIGPQVTVHHGVYIHSAAVIETMAVLFRGVDVGTHAKVCARCEIVEGARVKEWTVVWGSGRGVGMKRRVRAKGKVVNPLLVGAGAEGVREGRVVEDARLVAVKRERETLARYILQARKR
ncbi:trimeric LpxA-like protein [Aspergillus karnatakaensis]|uniref:transferase hexapeptide domain protein n=1 Tax=Aspergillus karnatakaensis TaxID=1810916 RepID=UPI003CCDC853